MRLHEFASDQVTVWFNPAYKGTDLNKDYWNSKPTKQIDINKLIPNEPEVENEPNVYRDRYNTGEDVDPILVTKHPCVSGYLVLDGNHRYFAAKDTGMQTMEVVEIPSNVVTHRGDIPKIKKENVVEGKRVPRKKGQPAKSKKHSDLYTDENPKGTIHGLGFKDEATARSSVSKIRKSGRSHAHKIQAAVAMEQRAKAAGKSGPAAIYRKYINAMKKKTKAKKEDIATENFADGKKKGKSRPGRVKRSGASCKGSVTSLRAKAKKASGERAKMYHWCANMKSGRNK